MINVDSKSGKESVLKSIGNNFFASREYQQSVQAYQSLRKGN